MLFLDVILDLKCPSDVYFGELESCNLTITRESSTIKVNLEIHDIDGAKDLDLRKNLTFNINCK